MRVYFEYKCNEASYFYHAKGKGVSPLVKWASEKFGADDPFTRMLVAEHEWIEDVIRRRNAVEHPTVRSDAVIQDAVAANDFGIDVREQRVRDVLLFRELG